MNQQTIDPSFIWLYSSILESALDADEWIETTRELCNMGGMVTLFTAGLSGSRLIGDTRVYCIPNMTRRATNYLADGYLNITSKMRNFLKISHNLLWGIWPSGVNLGLFNICKPGWSIGWRVNKNDHRRKMAWRKLHASMPGFLA